MKFLKKIEYYNRIAVYSILKVILRTRQINIPLNKHNVKRILISRYDAIGDLIVTIPALRLIKKNYPDAQIDMIVSNRNLQIAKNEPSITNIFIYDGTFQSLRKLSDLKKNKYDLVISMVFNNKSKAGIVGKTVAAKDTMIFTDLEVRRKNLYSAFFNAQVDLDDIRDKITMLEILCKMTSRILGLKFEKSEIDKKLHFSQESEIKAIDFLKINGIDKYFVFNISSGNEYRTLSINKNIELIKNLLKFNQKILIIADKKDANIALEIKNKINHQNCDVYPTGSIDDVIAIISRTSFVFTPDTSIVHIASAFDIPNFILYSSKASYITEWLPYNCPFDVIISNPGEPIENIETAYIIKKMNEFLSSVC
jgi:ADP-heptose:LPS heptosyltransferase